MSTKRNFEAAVVDSEVLVRTIGDPFPRAAKPPLGPETHCKLAEAEVVAQAEAVVALVGVAAEVVERPEAADGQSGIGYYIG